MKVSLQEPWNFLWPTGRKPDVYPTAVLHDPLTHITFATVETELMPVFPDVLREVATCTSGSIVLASEACRVASLPDAQPHVA